MATVASRLLGGSGDTDRVVSSNGSGSTFRLGKDQQAGAEVALWGLEIWCSGKQRAEARQPSVAAKTGGRAEARASVAVATVVGNYSRTATSRAAGTAVARVGVPAQQRTGAGCK
ncbi:hypothetical protein ACJRO7_018083 [Eucalyptus globulus]|uniref:Uncharacterized protein n=1 Tax=Eucalyptus globulus TaxID=34317 RepID=A0ABD3KZ52_EUCGL